MENPKLFKNSNPEIFAQIHPTLNINIDLDSLTKGSTKKLYFICEFCKETFLATVANRAKDTKHKKCCYSQRQKMTKWTTESFIEKSKEIHLNKFDYSETVYISQKDYVILTCNVCKTRFLQKCLNHISKKSGCKVCANKNSSSLQMKSQNDYLQQIISIHGTEKYNYDKVVYKGDKVKVEIYCNFCEMFFSKQAGSFLVSSGCPTCSRKNAGLLKRKTKEQFVEIAKKVHKDLYNYDEVEYVTCHTKVKIYCNLCKKFFTQTPAHHENFEGCPYHWSKLVSDSQRMSTEEFIRKNKKVHENKFAYDKTIYVSTHEPLILFCNLCKEDIKMIPSNLLRGAGCYTCAHKRIALLQTKTPEEFMEEALILWKDKIDFTKTSYINSKNKVILICKFHNFEYKQNPSSLLNGMNGCVHCVKDKTESVAAQNCRKYLTDKNIKFECEKRFDVLPNRYYDFVFEFKDVKFCVEIDGDQHFKFKSHWHYDFENFLKNQRIDVLKNETVIELGYVMVRISETCYENVSNFLDYALNCGNYSKKLFFDNEKKYEHMMR